MTLRCLFRLVLLVEGSSYVSMVSKLLRLNASLYRGAALSNVSLSQDREFMRVLTEAGSWRMTEGGWFERRLTKRGSSLGFLYGLYVPFVKSNVKSKKFVVSWFACAVILSPRLLKT